MNLNFKTKILPHVVAVVAFILILLIYFPSAFFENKTLPQNDVMQGIAAGREATDFRESTGQEALWTTSMFSGMPLYFINVKYSGDFIVNGIHKIFYIFPRPADAILLTFLCFYLMLSVFGCSSFISFIGAFAYAFGTYNIISLEAGHMYKIWAIAYIPLVLAGIILTFKKQYIIGLVITALGVALELGAQHYQITYYFLLALFFYFLSKIIEVIKTGEYLPFFKASGILLIAVLIGIGTNFGRLWALEEYSKYSTRGQSELKQEIKSNGSGLERDYVFAWSQGIGETFTLLIPNLFGGASNVQLDKGSETYSALKKAGVPASDIKQFLMNVPLYWGDQPFTSGPIYGGVIIIFLFIFSMFVLEGKYKYWILGAALFSIVLSWGKNFQAFNYFMFDYFPGYNKFRAVSMAMTIALFCFPLGAALGLNKILESESLHKYSKPLLISSGITLGLILIIALFFMGGSYDGLADEQFKQYEWLLTAIHEDRGNMIKGDALRGFVLVGLSSALLYMFLNKKLDKKYVISGLIVLVVFDLFSVDKRYLNKNSFTKKAKTGLFERSQADEMILQDTSYYRVYYAPNPFNNALVSYYHKSIGGYSGAKMRRYQDLIDEHLNKQNLKVFNMLNTKYIITGDPQNPIQKNSEAMGPVWLVENIKKVSSPDEEIKDLKEFDPAQTAILDNKKFKSTQTTFSDSGKIELIDRSSPSYLKYKYSSSDKSFAVFSEIYYPEGWDAYLDGKKTEYVRVDYVLRGMELPAGEHIIEFKFEPKSYFIGNKIMFISSSILLLLIIAGVVIQTKKKQVDLKG